MSAYCTVEQVKQRRTGDVPVESPAFDVTIGLAITEKSDLIDKEVRLMRGQPEGWTFLPGTPVTRRYTAGWGTSLVLIDDATAISSVAILDTGGNVQQVLVAGTDYLPRPLNTLPITGLVLTNGGWWPSYPGGVSVSLTPGYGTSIPPNVEEACIAEVIRTIAGGQAGEDDRLGITPYGSVVVSKALLQSTVRMLARYRDGAGFLRGGF